MTRVSICFAFLALIGGLSPSQAEPRLEGVSAFGDWRADAPGARRLITPVDLPKPNATVSSA